MNFGKVSPKYLISALALVGCVVGGLPAVSFAQSGLPGLTLCWSGRCPKELNYRLDFGGKADVTDRYRLRIPASEMKLAVAQFSISYPDYYDGIFDINAVEVIVKDQSIPLEEVVWDKENRRLDIFPKEPVSAGQKVELQLSNVKNPAYGGFFYFNANIQTPGDVPLLRYLGTWVISIN